MKALIKTGIFVAGCLSTFSINAYEIAAEFSADAVQSIPGRPSMNVKMFISKKAVRTESKMNGNTVVEIVYEKEKRRVLLNTMRKTYVEQKTQNKNTVVTHDMSRSPCAGITNTTCKKLGAEKINGRKATKWEMTVLRNGRSFKSLYWLDDKYHMPLREQLHDGTVATMALSGKEKVNGRNTEKWTFSAIRPDGQTMESQQWYDPKLKMVIREALSGGYVRELRNIKVSRQDKNLFKIPSDYKKESMPAMANQRPAR